MFEADSPPPAEIHHNQSEMYKHKGQGGHLFSPSHTTPSPENARRKESSVTDDEPRVCPLGTGNRNVNTHTHPPTIPPKTSVFV